MRMCKVRLGENLIEKLLLSKRLVTLSMNFLQVFTLNFKLVLVFKPPFLTDAVESERERESVL